ncbi:MAG: hypothetical protein NUW01_12090 [Gemmatimonadaceae bacterium]|nr:hypothetical protein [Gemmatimonadaceae bacterium]
MTTPAIVAAEDMATATLVASYDALRRVALGHSGPDDGPSLGFTVLVRQGMTTWLRAWAACPPPPPLAPHGASLTALPTIVHTELAQAWAHMALAHQEAAWI